MHSQYIISRSAGKEEARRHIAYGLLCFPATKRFSGMALDSRPVSPPLEPG